MHARYRGIEGPSPFAVNAASSNKLGIKRPGSSGVVLIVTLGVLALLSLLAVVFVTTMRVERASSRNYVDAVRAMLAAESGVEQVQGRIQTAVKGADRPPDQFSIAEDTSSDWLYGVPTSSTNRAVYDPSIPLEVAEYASFSMDPDTGAARTLLLQGKTNLSGGNRFAVSGFVEPSYPDGLNYFALKVRDCASMLFVNGPDENDGNPDLDVARTVAPLSANQRKLLNNLGAILNAERGLTFANLGDRLDTYRMNTLKRNYLTKSEMEAALGLTEEEAAANYRIVREFVTPYAYVNFSTINPGRFAHPRPHDPNILFLPEGAAGAYRLESDRPAYAAGKLEPKSFSLGLLGPSSVFPPSLPKFILRSCGSDRLLADTTGSISPYHSGRPDQWFKGELDNDTMGVMSPTQILGSLEPRAPVNINTASRDVLRAVLTGIGALYLDRTGFVGDDPWRPTVFGGMGYVSPDYTVAITPEQASKIADLIINHREVLIQNGSPPYLRTPGYGFATWRDFNEFVDNQIATDTFGQTRDQLLSSTGPGSANPTVFENLAFLAAIKANFNPNSHINKFNPDRTLDARFGDVDKADLTNWTTEFCFRSMGFFEIESLGRVLGPVRADNVYPVVAEKKVSTIVRLYDVYRHSSQLEFESNKTESTGVISYPESVPNLGSQYAAEYDGYLTAGTTDNDESYIPAGTTFFRNFLSSFGPDAAGQAVQGVSVVNPGPPGSGSMSDLFPDGLFAHESRRYPNYVEEWRYGAPRFGGNVDKYLRYGRADDKVDREGTLIMWVKPTWTAAEFASDSNSGPQIGDQLVTSPVPQAEGSRAFFTVGDAGYTREGATEARNRLAFFARKRDPNNTYIMGYHSDTMTGGWAGTGLAGGQGMTFQDIHFYYGRFYANHARLLNQYSQPRNPRNWAYPGLWHYLAFLWRGSESWVIVDGVTEGGDDPVSAAGSISNIGSDWSIFIGNNRHREKSTNGYPVNADATIDGVEIYPDRNMTRATNPPDRYLPGGTFTSTIAGGGGVSHGGNVANIAWTSFHPELDTMTSSIQFSVTVGGDMFPVPSDGIGGDLEGRGRPVDLSIQSGDTLGYKLQFELDGSWLVASPILDDVSITVLRDTPQAFFWSVE